MVGNSGYVQQNPVILISDSSNNQQSQRSRSCTGTMFLLSVSLAGNLWRIKWLFGDLRKYLFVLLSLYKNFVWRQNERKGGDGVVCQALTEGFSGTGLFHWSLLKSHSYPLSNENTWLSMTLVERDFQLCCWSRRYPLCCLKLYVFVYMYREWQRGSCGRFIWHKKSCADKD